MKAELVIHPHTNEQMQAFLAKPGHAVIISGATGSGKFSLAIRLVESALKIESHEDYPYGMVVSPEAGKSIGVEAVRELEHFLSLKVPGKNDLNRFVIFENGHTMTVEAQNALLKTLEEPPAGSLIVITSASEHDLLPTVRSRAQNISVKKPDRSDLERYFESQGHDSKNIQQAVSISGGLPGLMHSILTGEDHPLSAATEYARQLLVKSQYERLLLVDELAKNKDLALNVAFILQQMSHVSLQKADGVQAKNWQNILEAAYNLSEQLTNSAQPKLAITNLMLQL